MTIIVAAYTAHGVVMAADSQTSAGWQKLQQEVPKLWMDGDLAFGATGTTRGAQVLKYHTDWPSWNPDHDPIRTGDQWESWLVRRVVPAMHEACGNHGALKDSEGVKTMDAAILLCTSDNIAEICTDGAVVIEHCGRMAIGSGFAEALGRLGNEGPWTEEEIIDAARRSTLTNRGCGGPITVLRVRDKLIRTVE